MIRFGKGEKVGTLFMRGRQVFEIAEGPHLLAEPVLSLSPENDDPPKLSPLRGQRP
jgi:hypothetical protein